MKEEFADLLFSVNINNKTGYIYFLFDHKSYQARMVIFQVLKYMINIWESKIHDGTGKRLEIELPIILPLVVYHDEGKWSIKKAKKMAKKMIINGEPLEKIISYTELSIEEINEIREEM